MGEKWDVVVEETNDRGNPHSDWQPITRVQRSEEGARKMFATARAAAPGCGDRSVTLRCDGVAVESWSKR